MVYKCKCGNAGGSTKFYVKEGGTHIGLYCKRCNKWIKWLSQSEATYLFTNKVKTAPSAKSEDTTKTTKSASAALKASSNISEIIAIDRSKISAFGITHKGDVFIDAAGMRYNITRASILRGKSKQDMYNTIYQMVSSLALDNILQFELEDIGSRSDNKSDKANNNLGMSAIPIRDPLPPKPLKAGEKTTAALLTEKNMAIDDDELPW